MYTDIELLWYAPKESSALNNHSLAILYEKTRILNRAFKLNRYNYVHTFYARHTHRLYILRSHDDIFVDISWPYRTFAHDGDGGSGSPVYSIYNIQSTSRHTYHRWTVSRPTYLPNNHTHTRRNIIICELSHKVINASWTHSVNIVDKCITWFEFETLLMILYLSKM